MKTQSTSQTIGRLCICLGIISIAKVVRSLDSLAHLVSLVFATLCLFSLVCVCVCVCVCVQLTPALCNPVDCSPPGSSVHGIFQAGILERVPISFSTGSSQSRDQTYVSFLVPPWPIRFLILKARKLGSESPEIKIQLTNYFPAM